MKSIVAIIIGIAVLILVADSLYTVDMREQVIITQFGEPVGGPLKDPGLHFKLPFMQKVNRLDKRWLEWDGEVDEMRTAEKTPILVDTYARWRISDPLLFFKRLRTEQSAQTRIDDIIESETRNVLAANRLIEIVRSTNRELPTRFEVTTEEDEGGTATKESRDLAAAEEAEAEHRVKQATIISQKIMEGRDNLTAAILEKVVNVVPEYGIEVVDLRFQRVNYTPPVEKENFERMIAERKRIADKYRAEGQGESDRIRGRITKEVKTIESQAYETVQVIEGGADAEATTIYAGAHNLDPGLYRLLKSLESYESTFDENTWVLMSTDSDYFQALKSMR